MNNYQTKDTKLIFGNGTNVDFEYPIRKTLSIDSIVVVLLEIPSKASYNQNVFALTNTGDYLWQICKVELFFEGADCPYIDMNMNSKDQLVLFNWCDTAVIVNYETGEVLDKYNSK